MGYNKAITNTRQEELSRFCAALDNPNRIVLLENLACQGNCVKDDFLAVEGLSNPKEKK